MGLMRAMCQNFRIKIIDEKLKAKKIAGKR
jgi:hypothetical protein